MIKQSFVGGFRLFRHGLDGQDIYWVFIMENETLMLEVNINSLDHFNVGSKPNGNFF